MNSLRTRLWKIPLLFIVALALSILCEAASKTCPPGKKEGLLGNGTCVSLDNYDIISSVHWMASPPTTTCNNITTVQGIAVCEDNLPEDCLIWSQITTTWCNDIGSLEFEKYWSKRCDVVIYHYTTYFGGNVCSREAGATWVDYPRLSLVRNNLWGAKCFNCLFSHIKLPTSDKNVNFLKIQLKGESEDEHHGTQYTVLSDFYLHKRGLEDRIEQIGVLTEYTHETLVDSVGREAEHAWNLWGSRMFLSKYASISTVRVQGTFKDQPRQFSRLLDRARLPSNVAYYYHTFMRLKDSNVISKNEKVLEEWKAYEPPSLHADVPKYCTLPSSHDDSEMQSWIVRELRVRCHPTRLWVPCEYDREYDSFIPCPQELMNTLAEDYAITKNWCDFNSPDAEIKPLTMVDKGASDSFNRPHLARTKAVRIAFLITVYKDDALVKRLLSRLYGSEHYYLIHVDPAGASGEFTLAMRTLAAKYPNVYISMDVPIVYGASTASILLSRAMAWYLKSASGWDYFMPLTGSDYPLLPLQRLEKILYSQETPMPFVMAWTPGTSTHIFRLEKTHPLFAQDDSIALSISTVQKERGKVLGAVPMEFRSNNFGPPLFCNGQTAFYHLDNRSNKSRSGVLDTQWLFPRDKLKNRGRANIDEDPLSSSPSSDGVFRVWKKSDPGTTGAYDKESVEYIVNSMEGKKYYHFFKHMLLGSEEHYYVSLLYNWPRTKAFIQTLSAESVWNTWKFGLRESPALGFQTHTHFLSTSEFEILKGFSKRGTFFARKFSSNKTSELLDMIDSYMLLNVTTEAGLYWPGFYTVDTTTRGRDWVKSFRESKKNKKTSEINDSKSEISVLKESGNNTITGLGSGLELGLWAGLGSELTSTEKGAKRKRRTSKNSK